jgi:hypothetical protein
MPARKAISLSSSSTVERVENPDCAGKAMGSRGEIR